MTLHVYRKPEVTADMYAEAAVSGVKNLVKMDESRSLIFVTHNHSKVHQGKHYSLSHYFATIAAGNSADVLMVLGAYQNHCNTAVAVTGAAVFRIYEGATYSSVGTSIVARNNNRTSLQTSSTTFGHTPTITGTGTEIYATVIPGGTTGNKVGSQDDGPEEQFVLAPNTTYLFRVSNLSGQDVALTINLSFYEV